MGHQPLRPGIEGIDHGGRRCDGQHAHYDHHDARELEDAAGGLGHSLEISVELIFVVEHAKVYTACGGCQVLP